MISAKTARPADNGFTVVPRRAAQGIASRRSNDRYLLRLEDHDRRAEVRVIAEGLDEIERAKERVHVGSLHTAATAVNEPHLAEAALAGGEQIVARYVADLRWAEGVEIECVFDGDLDWDIGKIVGHRS